MASGVRSQKDRPCMGDLFGQSFRICDAKFQVLWRETIRQGSGLIQIPHGNDRAEIAPGCPCDGASGQGLKPRVHRVGNGFGERGICGDQNRLCAFIMFGLAEQVERDPIGIIVAISQARRSCR